jgi:hypothetical protein
LEDAVVYLQKMSRDDRVIVGCLETAGEELADARRRVETIQEERASA